MNEFSLMILFVAIVNILTMIVILCAVGDLNIKVGKIMERFNISKTEKVKERK
jgi:hypothetical protein